MKDISPEHLERFKQWYVRPFEWLRHQGGIRHVERWDGGFISIMIGCSLMERYFRRRTNTHLKASKEEKKKYLEDNRIGFDDAFKHSAADYFQLPTNNINQFYLIFRNGMMHQGMPKVIEERSENGELQCVYTYSIQAGHPRLPEIEKSKNKVHLKLDPWEFTQTMIDLFLSNPEVLEEEFECGLAQIYSE